jgi:hypothetical protein
MHHMTPLQIALREFTVKIVAFELAIEPITAETPLTPKLQAKIAEVQSRPWMKDCIRDLATIEMLDEIVRR